MKTILVVLILSIFNLCKVTAQKKLYTPLSKRLNKIARLKAEGNKITEVSKNIYKIQYRNGKTIYKNLGDYTPTETLKLSKTASFDSTIIDLTTIDTSLYSYKYKFWCRVPVSGWQYRPTRVGDINDNGYPEIYGPQMKSYKSPWDTSIVVMEMNKYGNFDSIYAYKNTIDTKTIYDIDNDGNDEIEIMSKYSKRVDSANFYEWDSYLFFKKPNHFSLATGLSFTFTKIAPGWPNNSQLDYHYFGDWDGDNLTDYIFIEDQLYIDIYEYGPLSDNFDSVYSYYTFQNDQYYSGFAIGDFDNDGRTEFFAGSVHGKVLSIENKGVHSYAPNWQGSVETYNAYLLTQTNDLDGNGKKEIWIGGDAFYKGVAKTRITILETNGNNSYQEVGRIDLIGVFSFDAGNMQVLDVDNDGKDEVMICIDGNVIILKFAGSKNDQKYNVFYIKQNNRPDISYYGARMYDFKDNGQYGIIISEVQFNSTGNNWPFFSDIYYPDSTIAGIKNKIVKPNSYMLFQNYPNPFNPETKIKFSIPELSYVTVNVYNILGKEINTLTEKKYSPGTYYLNWDAGSTGNSLPSGVYFIKLTAKSNKSQFIKTIKTVLLK